MILTSGCAHLSSKTYDAQGHIQTCASVYTFLDSQSTLAKFRNTTGGTNGSGTYVSNLDASSSSSNLVQILNAVSSLAASLPK